jgi:hypothetical protein
MMKRYYTLLLLLLIIAVPVIHAQDECCGILPEDISEYPEPNVKPLVIDDSVLYDRIYRRVEGEVQIHDAPGGNVISSLDAGYNFVTIRSTQGQWAEISQGKWISTATLNDDVSISRYAGVRLPEEKLPYPMAWLLRHTRPSSAPGVESPSEGPFLYRYTRINIYDTVEIDGYRWYQIGVDQWVHQFNVAKIIPVERPDDGESEKWISVDLYEQVLIAYEGETPVFATLVSSGLPAWSTNEGLFNVYLRYPRTVMSGAEGREDFYYLEEVPWTMYFDDDIALHGTFWHDGFGYRQSHGCVNLSITDAHWLYHWASDEFDLSVDNDAGPAVYVYSSGEYE